MCSGADLGGLCNQRQVLLDAIHSRQNILAAGGTKSGKTTFLNAVLAEIATTGDRVVLLEDTKELQCAAPDMNRLLTTANKTMEDLLRDTLRLTPERQPSIPNSARRVEQILAVDGWDAKKEEYLVREQ